MDEVSDVIFASSLRHQTNVFLPAYKWGVVRVVNFPIDEPYQSYQKRRQERKTGDRGTSQGTARKACRSVCHDNLIKADILAK